MDFNLTQPQKMLRDSVREYLKDKIVPIADENDRKGPMTGNEARQLLKGLVPFGYIGTLIPEEKDGPGLSRVEWGIIYKELRKAWASLGDIAGATSLCASLMCRFSRDHLVEKYLPLLLQGDMIGCTAVTEPNAGNDTAAIETTAVSEGDHYRLSGRKRWITNGTIADLVLVLTKVNGPEDEETALALATVEKKDVSYEAVDLAKMGIKAAPTAELIFDHCAVPKENLFLLSEKDALKEAYQWLNFARCHAAVSSIGIAEAALEAAARYAGQRIQFGRPLGKFQMIQTMIADSATDIEAAELLTFRALQLIDEGKNGKKEASMAKLFASEMAVRVASKAIQIHGAYGLSDEYPLERYFRDARIFPFVYGSTQLQQLIVAKDVTGLSAVT